MTSQFYCRLGKFVLLAMDQTFLGYLKSATYHSSWVVYFVVNVVCFLMYGVDKAKAIYNQWRIKERTLLIFSVFGPFGAIIAMILFWHKVRKIKFVAFNVFMIIVHIIMYIVWFI